MSTATAHAVNPAEQAVSLWHLFDAFAAIPHSAASLMLHESQTPGAAESLKAWCEATGRECRDSIVYGDRWYVNAKVSLVELGEHIAVLDYRPVDDAEIAEHHAQIVREQNRILNPTPAEIAANQESSK